MKTIERYICIVDYTDKFGCFVAKGEIRILEYDESETAFIAVFKRAFSVPIRHWELIPPSKLEQALQRLKHEKTS